MDLQFSNRSHIVAYTGSLRLTRALICEIKSLTGTDAVTINALDLHTIIHQRTAT
jgi:hypothetical protein